MKEAEIITLRAIALKLLERLKKRKRFRRDHNATSYSTETDVSFWYVLKDLPAEIITLRAIALKLVDRDLSGTRAKQRS